VASDAASFSDVRKLSDREYFGRVTLEYSPREDNHDCDRKQKPANLPSDVHYWPLNNPAMIEAALARQKKTIHASSRYTRSSSSVTTEDDT
jgi:hypothetical protein